MLYGRCFVKLRTPTSLSLFVLHFCWFLLCTRCIGQTPLSANQNYLFLYKGQLSMFNLSTDDEMSINLCKFSLPLATQNQMFFIPEI